MAGELSKVVSGEVAKRALQAAFPMMKPVYRARYGVSGESAERGLEKTRAALDRIQSERGPRDYLVGDEFTVADLTAAALMSPVIRPPEFPYLTSMIPAGLVEIRESLLAHPGAAWVLEMYRRHRGTSAEVSRTPARAR